MLSGSSGTGKTTLAIVIAKKCGYNPYRISLGNESSLDSLIFSIKNILQGKSRTEATKGQSLLIIDEIDAFFATNPHSAKRIVDLITKKPIIATSTSSRGVKDQAESSKNDDKSEDAKDDHADYTNTMNPNSQNQTNRPNPQTMPH